MKGTIKAGDSLIRCSGIVIVKTKMVSYSARLISVLAFVVALDGCKQIRLRTGIVLGTSESNNIVAVEG